VALPGIRVDVADSMGSHDLYLVFIGEPVKEGAPLMSLSSVRLRNERTPLAAEAVPKS
jgi:hypothetical protein